VEPKAPGLGEGVGVGVGGTCTHNGLLYKYARAVHFEGENVLVQPNGDSFSRMTLLNCSYSPHISVSRYRYLLYSSISL
jgi:hypothetical protein